MSKIYIYIYICMPWKNNTFYNSVCVCVCVCVCVSLVVQHAKRMCHIVVTHLSANTVFSHYLKKDSIFWKKVLNVKDVFSFSPQLLSKTFLLLK